MAVRIVTDSTCDLSFEDRNRLGVYIVPLTVHFSDRVYLDDGIELKTEDFFDRLESSKKLPTTSQPSPQKFVDEFHRGLDAGDEIVGIFISSEISGTYQSAVIAKEELSSDKIIVVDSRSATMGLALLLSEAAKKRDEGFSAKQIAEHILVLSKKVRFMAILNTLKYLQKGGRISVSSALIGGIFDIKPIAAVVDGTVKSIGKARGLTAAMAAVLKKALAELPDLSYDVVLAHSCAHDLLEKFIGVLKEPLGLKNWMTCNIGSVIGTYSGKGAVGLAYIAK